jgi:hypothetical protein
VELASRGLGYKRSKYEEILEKHPRPSDRSCSEIVDNKIPRNKQKKP